ncbi:MAG: hypothetical protein ACTSW4_01700 [Candidatus Ranarchaeia archaeon]
MIIEFDVKKLATQVTTWDNLSKEHTVDGEVFFVQGHPFMIIREDRIFVRLKPELQSFIKEWPGIWPVHGRLLGLNQWVQVVASKTIQTGIRGLVRLAYEYAMRPRGVLL